MDGHPILRLLVQGAGVLLIFLVLLDVFLTVLYARIGTGVISDRLTCWTWRFFRWGSRWMGRRRAEWLSLAGPVSLVLLVAVWGLGGQGDFEVGYTHLAEMSSEMISFKEAHHFYSVVLYFRFREPHYAVSRLTLVVLDSVSLIKSGLDDQRYAWLKESAAVAQLWRATMTLFRILEETFFRCGVV